MKSSDLPPIRIPSFRPLFGAEEQEALRGVLDGRWLGIGKLTEQFEEALRDATGASFAIATTSGSAALHLALGELDMQPGDEVIVPSLTFVATIQMILAAGGTPVFCEVAPDTLNMDPWHVETLIGPRTRAIVPVHYGGYPCDMDRLLDLAAQRQLTVIEDAAHAIGSTWRGRKVGSAR